MLDHGFELSVDNCEKLKEKYSKIAGEIESVVFPVPRLQLKDGVSVDNAAVITFTSRQGKALHIHV